MKTKLIAMLLMAGTTMFAGVRFGVGVGFVAPAPIIVAAAPCPGPGYIFVNGVWTLPRLRYVGGRSIGGYWGGRHEVYGRGFRR